MEPYPNRQCGFIDDPDCQSGCGSVPTRTRTRSDGPDPLLTLALTLSNMNLTWHAFDGLGCRADMWSSRLSLHLVNRYIIVGPAPFEALGRVASCSRHCMVVRQRTTWVENGIQCHTRVQILVPVYRSTPRPIYILHTPNIKLPRSAEVLHSKLKWVRDFDSSTQSPGHTVNYNGSVTLIHPFQSHGPVVRKICQSNTTRL